MYNNHVKKVIAELLIGVYLGEIVGRPTLEIYVVKLFSKDIRRYIGSRFKDCSIFGARKEAKVLRSGVISFLNSTSSQLLLKHRKYFHSKYVDVLPYEELNMRGLTKKELEAIVMSEPGTATVKYFCYPNERTTSQAEVPNSFKRTHAIEHLETLPISYETEEQPEIQYQSSQVDTSGIKISNLSNEMNPQVAIVEIMTEDSMMLNAMKPSATTVGTTNRLSFTVPLNYIQKKIIVKSLASPNKIQILETNSICKATKRTQEIGPLWNKVNKSLSTEVEDDYKLIHLSFRFHDFINVFFVLEIGSKIWKTSNISTKFITDENIFEGRHPTALMKL